MFISPTDTLRFYSGSSASPGALLGTQVGPTTSPFYFVSSSRTMFMTVTTGATDTVWLRIAGRLDPTSNRACVMPRLGRLTCMVVPASDLLAPGMLTLYQVPALPSGASVSTHP